MIRANSLKFLININGERGGANIGCGNKSLIGAIAQPAVNRSLRHTDFWAGATLSGDFTNSVVELIDPLRNYASSLAKSRSEAEDLVQETLVRAWRSRSTFEEGTNLKAWLCKILRNSFYSDRLKRRLTVEDIDGRIALTIPCSPGQETRMRFAEILDAMDELKPEAREALVLIGLKGFSYEEAAELSGCAVGAMRSRLARARERLADLLDDHPGSRGEGFGSSLLNS